MRIAHCIQALVAVLGLAAVFHQVKSQEQFNETLRGTREKRSLRRGGRHFHLEDGYDVDFDAFEYMHYSHDERLPFEAGKLLSPRDNQMLLRQEARNKSAAECCPSVLEMIEPKAGKNQDGIFVDLYRDGAYRQRFYELSCHQEVLNKPCRFMDKKLHAHSRCVQRHSFTYALVKDTPSHRHKNFPTFPAHGPGGVTYTLDYISVRSGCSCVVTPNTKKKRNRPKHKRKLEDDMM